jgi:SAM-dependent methyltransferase
MEHIGCIVCEKDDTREILSGHDSRYGVSDEVFIVVRCNVCGLVYVNPRPAKDEIGRYYPPNYRTRETVQSSASVERRTRKYAEKRSALLFRNPWYIELDAGMTVLDAGCGAGEFLARAKALGCDAHGVDIDEATSTFLRETMHLNVMQCDIDAGTPFQTDFFDIVVMRHSLEHAHNPLNALREVRRIMKPTGLLVIGVPNIESLVSKITREKWKDLDIPRHLFHFSPSTLQALSHKAGLSVERIHHEFKVSKDSLRDWMGTGPLQSFLSSKPLRRVGGALLSLLRRGEWIVVKARNRRT